MILRRRSLMETLKRHQTLILLVLAGGQLVVLLTMPATIFTLKLLARAITHGYAGYMLFAPVLLISGLLFNKHARALNWRWLEWSPWGIRANLALAPMRLRFLWLPYAIVLGCCMPILAFLEEEIFRNGTHSLLRGLLWGGVAFGLVHLISCVTVRMTIYLTLVGLALVGIYTEGGLIAVFVTHASYNLLALVLVATEQHLPPKLRAQLGRIVPEQLLFGASDLPVTAPVVASVAPAVELTTPVVEPAATMVVERAAQVVEPPPVTGAQLQLAGIDGIDFVLEGEPPTPYDPASLAQAWPAHPRPTRQKARSSGSLPSDEAAEDPNVRT